MSASWPRPGGAGKATWRSISTTSTARAHRGSITGKTVAWVGDGNNMANTWLQASEILGFRVHLSTPSGYEVDQSVAGIRSNDSYRVFKDPMEACRGADLVTTDVWTSMGYEAENEARKKAFADWCVDSDMMRAARPDALSQSVSSRKQSS